MRPSPRGAVPREGVSREGGYSGRKSPSRAKPRVSVLSNEWVANVLSHLFGLPRIYGVGRDLAAATLTA